MVFFYMVAYLHENPTREKIIFLLKKNGPLSIEDLSTELHITSMGIRQHLLSLERKGYIDYVTKRQGIGRPAFLYRLTEKAQTLFPMAYDQFLIEMFKDIETNEGKQKIEELFRCHKNRFLKDLKDSSPVKKPLREKLSAVSHILDTKGYLTELGDTNSHYTLKIFNCPIYRLSYDFKDVCRYHLQMFRELLGKEVTRQSCIIDGDTSCSYSIPKNI
jgi:predicted ArsR family transcriptional regulator